MIMKQILLLGVIMAGGILLASVTFDAVWAQETTTVASTEPTKGGVRYLASPFPNPLPPSTRVRVAVLDVSGTLTRANNIALLLTHFRRRDLETKIGMKIDLANLSKERYRPKRGNVVYYREGFLRAAMLIAKVVPGEQTVLPMPVDFAAKMGVDVDVHLGPVTGQD